MTKTTNDGKAAAADVADALERLVLELDVVISAGEAALEVLPGDTGADMARAVLQGQYVLAREASNRARCFLRASCSLTV